VSFEPRDIGSPTLTWLALLGTLCAWIFGGALVGAIVTLAVAVFYGALFVGESIMRGAEIAASHGSRSRGDTDNA
jgi:hypothetical protein